MFSKLGEKVRSGVSQLRTGVTVLACSLAVLAVWMIAGQVPVGASKPSSMSHAWIDRPSSNVTLGQTYTTVATLTVPAGTYIIFGKAAVINSDNGPAIADCYLTTGDTMTISLDSWYGGIVEAETPISVQDSATFSVTTAITMSCRIDNISGGSASSISLTAIAVDALN
jgi:hypothetical protein